MNYVDLLFFQDAETVLKKKILVLHAPVKLFTLDKSLAIHCVEQFYCFPYREIKTESTMKLSNF